MDEGNWLRLLVDIAMGITVLEALVLALWRRKAAAGPTVGDLLGNLLAGFALMVALALALRGWPAPWVLACLAAAGIAHLWDLRRRLRVRLRAADSAVEGSA